MTEFQDARFMDDAAQQCCQGGPCHQGRQACPTPQECCVTEADRAWLLFHRRMCRVTVGIIAVGAVLVVWVMV